MSLQFSCSTKSFCPSSRARSVCPSSFPAAKVCYLLSLFPVSNTKDQSSALTMAIRETLLSCLFGIKLWDAQFMIRLYDINYNYELISKWIILSVPIIARKPSMSLYNSWAGWVCGEKCLIMFIFINLRLFLSFQFEFSKYEK